MWRFVLLAGGLLWAQPGWAIPPDTPIVNTAQVTYAVAGQDFQISDSATLRTDAAAGNSVPLSASLSSGLIAENLPGGLIGELVVQDLDPADTHSFTLTDPRFVITGSSLSLAPGVALDFETENSIDVNVTVIDSQGGALNTTVSITVEDVNEAPLGITLDATTVSAATPGAVVGSLSVLDPDIGDVHTWVPNDPRFVVVDTVLRLADGMTLPLGETVNLQLEATDSGGLSISDVFVIEAVPPGGGSGDAASISALVYAPGAAGAQTTAISPSRCDTGSGLQDLPPPVTADGTVLGLSAPLPLLPSAITTAGAAVFIQVVDASANVDAAINDRLLVQLQNAGGDQESVELAETGANTGVFAGYFPLRRSSPASADCVLGVALDDTITLTYVDADNPADQAVVQVRVDPLSRVFESSTGQLLSGVQLTLLESPSGLPATVFAEDGVTPLTAVQISGDAAQQLPPGGYRFPYVVPGEYQLQILPPNRFAFPSTVADAQLQALAGAPYQLSPGSRGQPFTVPVGPGFWLDVPLDLLPVTPSNSTIELLTPAAAGASAGQSLAISDTQCVTDTGVVQVTDLNSLVQGDITLPANLQVVDTTRMGRGEVLVIRLTDPDQDLDAFTPDRVEVQVDVVGEVDVERLSLLETGASTGVFSGVLQSSLELPAPNNCRLEADFGAQIEVTYVDALDPADQSQAELELDPGFRLISSVNGAPVDGLRVTLLDAATGQPATAAAFGRDGTSAFPVSVVTGGVVEDGAGIEYNFSPGGFYFPRLLPGQYQLQVESTGAYAFPSTVPDVVLDNLPGGPFVLAQGSRGGVFTVADGTPVAFDLPVDPLLAEVFVSKQADRERAAVGDFIQYVVRIENAPAASAGNQLELIDDLPVGFRYVPDSLQIDGALGGAPQISDDGQQLRLTLGDIEPGGAIEVRYVTEITGVTPVGVARNSATITGAGVNTAFADVLIHEDLFLSKSFIVGQVFDGDCDAAAPGGLADVRIWLENGAFIVTDQEGKFHFEGVEPGTHVVQLDTATLPASHELVACEANTQFAGSSHSQFVDVQAGALWRADFYVREKPAQQADVVSRLDAEVDDGLVHYRYHIVGGAVALDKIMATVMLDEQLAYVGGTTRVNGLRKADPRGIEAGALTFRLPPSTEAFEYVLEFTAFVKHGKGQLETRGVLQLGNAAGQYRSEVAVSRLGLNWPATLVTIAESAPGLPIFQQAKSAASARALQRAAQSNAAQLDNVGGPVEAADKAGVAVQSRVHEPALSESRSRSSIQRTRVSAVVGEDDRWPYTLPPQDEGAAPPLDRAWLAANPDAVGIVWPPVNYNPVMPAITVAVVHPSEQRPQLLVDGELVSPLTFASVTRDHDLQLSISRWENVSISERDSRIVAQLQDADGNTLETHVREVHYSGSPARAELITSESHLIADGVFPPVLAVRFYDRAGYPLRAGTTGEFSISAPFAALDKTKHLENSRNAYANERYKVLRDGIAYIQLEPTIETGEVALRFAFDGVRTEQIRARLRPGMRDWIMVGLAEGSYSWQDLSGNLRGLQAEDLDDGPVRDGRVAFYAKGMVKGDWLLTAAYDTDKAFERTLREQIDPQQFYTLYGDGAEQRFDAQSQRKLYLKLEKQRFGALFGDFDTDFSRSELARYERRLNGVDVGYYGQRVELKAFASETDQAFVRDELSGDGTSGIYRLSNQRLVRNSESVRIVTRDRFSPDQILQSETLVRFRDYTIDFDLGQLIFKQPVFSQDNQFNPIFIEVEYEVAGPGASDELVIGARAAYRLDEQDSELALTYIDDATQGQDGQLAGLDLTYKINDLQRVTVELSRSETALGGEADAYLFEWRHRGNRFAGRLYATEQEDGFGLGHQSSLEVGTRRIGLEGEYRWREDLLLRGQTFQQSLLSTAADRWIADMQIEYRQGRNQLSGGLRAVREDAPEAEGLDATQLLAGISRSVLHNRVTLRADAELDISAGADNTDYPSRAILGAEYALFNDVRVSLEQELTWGSTRNTQDTRLGLRSRPWQGADVGTSITRQSGENGNRLFATTGLLQQWRVNEHWLLDAGMDRVQTLTTGGSGVQQNPQGLLFNPQQPPASGSFDQDFTALFSGFTYNRETWQVSSRLEYHTGDEADRWNLLAGANRQLAEGRVISSSVAWFKEDRLDGARQTSADLRLGLAWRPSDSAWTLLNRSDLIVTELRDAQFDRRGRKWVNNFGANFKPRRGLPHQLALQLGLKYVLETIDAQEFDGLTLLYGGQYRYHLTPRWDVGLQAAALHSFSADTVEYSWGVAAGFNAYRDAWISVGYNFRGFNDADFVAADYTARGPFIKLRVKFDQSIAKRFLAFAGLEASSARLPANSR